MNKFFSDAQFQAIEESGTLSDNYFGEVLKKIQKLIGNDHCLILDVGCGSGLFFAKLTQAENVELIGVDAPSTQKKVAITRGYKEVLDIEDLSTECLPFKDDTFHFVVCKDVFEHLLEPSFTLKEIKRVLKKDGLLLLHVPNHFSLYGRLKFLFTNNLDTFKYFGSDDRWTYPHVRFFKHPNFIDKLLIEGFELEQDLSSFFPALPLVSRTVMTRTLAQYVAKLSPASLCASCTAIFRKGD